MNENKRRISKCEVCPFYAKNFETGRWECSMTRNKLKEGKVKKGESLYVIVKSCIFNQKFSIIKDEEIKNTIIERWLKANEQIR